MEWFGWSHYRFTSPTGKVVLTNPFTSNPDSPIKPEDIEEADLIVVADGHGDEVGSTVAIGNQTGATVLAPGGVNSWLVEQGIPRAQIPNDIIRSLRPRHVADTSEACERRKASARLVGPKTEVSDAEWTPRRFVPTASRAVLKLATLRGQCPPLPLPSLSAGGLEGNGKPETLNSADLAPSDR